MNPTVTRASDAPSSAGLSVGEVIAERYRIDAVLGEGGMGVVYRAEHLHLHKPHALKVLLPQFSSSPDIVARFEREAVAAGNIQSPHVAAATDFGRLPDGSFFLVMEFVNGRTLRGALEGAPFDPVRALHITKGIASALLAAHGVGIVHRDIKPENIMLVERGGDPDFVKVLDFGIAKLEGAGPGLAAAPLTQAGAVIGTLDYMSPEQALGQPVDARSDLYSVGVVLYEMLAGNAPFTGNAMTMLRQRVVGDAPELPPSVAVDVHPRVSNLLRRLLAKVPDDRVASAAELLAGIDDCRPAASPRAVEDPRGLLRVATPRNLVLMAVGVAVLVVSIVAMVAGGKTEAPKSIAGAPTASIPGEAPSSSPPVTPTAQSMEPVSLLPPPPAPSSAPPAARPSPSQSPSRRTGPGGIYIPPPSQWFK